MRASIAIPLAIVLASSSGQAAECRRVDPELVYCPAPQPPRVTELGEARVVVELTVMPDGSVSKARAISFAGHRTWQAAVLKATMQWRYKPDNQVKVKVVPIELNLGG